MSEIAYARLLRAARWAELNHKPYGTDAYAPTWEVLYELAARVQAGALELPDLGAGDDSTPWSGVLRDLRRGGIDVWELACARTGAAPPVVWYNGVLESR